MLVCSYRFYLIIFTAMLLLSGCDMQRKEQHHPLFIKANKFKQAGDYQLAVEYYKRLLNIYPESPATHKALATIYDDQLMQYLAALYHYDRYLEYAPKASDHNDMQKWRNAVQRKYYLKARRVYNDPNDVQLLKRQNNTLNLSLKKIAVRQRQLVNYIRKVKIEIATIRKNVGQLKTQNIDLEIKYERSVGELKNAHNQLAKTNSEISKLRVLNLKLIDTKTDETDSEEETEEKKTAVLESKTPAADEIMSDQEKAVKTELQSAPKVETTIAETGQQLYMVKSGDTLSSISRKFYGSSNHYRHIMNANKRLLKSAKELRPGQQLIIPQLKVQ